MNNGLWLASFGLVLFLQISSDNAQAYPSVSDSSDIIADPGFGYKSNIDHKSYQADTIMNTSSSVGVFKFRIRDGGNVLDSDSLFTMLKEIAFQVNHIQRIRSAALFNGNAMLNNDPSIDTTGHTISFADLDGPSFIAPDDGEKAITLRFSFDSIMVDNIQFLISVKSALADSSGSQFLMSNGGGAASGTFGDRNRIEVTAVSLEFGLQPENGEVHTLLDPFEIWAVDACMNIDVDVDTGVIIASTGAGLNVSNPYMLSSGVLQVYDAAFDQSQSGVQIIATGFGTTVVSDSFDIDTVLWNLGDYRTNPLFTAVNPSSNISFSSCGAVNGVFPWQSWSGAVWVDMTNTQLQAPSNLVVKPPVMIITHGDQAFNSHVEPGNGTGYKDIFIKEGGLVKVLDSVGIQVGAASKMTVGYGGFLEIAGMLSLDTSTELSVENGGHLIISNPDMHVGHPLWGGIEKFDSGSNFLVGNWDFVLPDAAMITDSARFSPNSNGFLFGNVIVNAIVPSDFSIVGVDGEIGLCKGNLTINTNSGDVISVVHSVNKSHVMLGGDLRLLSGSFSFMQSGSDSSDQQVSIAGDIMGANGQLKLISTSGVITKACVNLDGDLLLDSACVLTSDLADAVLKFSGVHRQMIDVAQSVENVSLLAEAGSDVVLSSNNLKFNGNCELVIDSGASFNFGFKGDTALLVEQVGGGGNKFISRPGSKLVITSPFGLSRSGGGPGNLSGLPSSNKSISQLATFHYRGKTHQGSGDALTSGSNGKVVIIELANDSLKFTPGNHIGISGSGGIDSLGGKLEIISGIVVGTDSADFSGSGRLVMKGGKYQIECLDAVLLPRLSGGMASEYELTGGCIELSADGAQILRGGRSYHHLIISGYSSGTGSDHKSISSSIVVNEVLDVRDSCIFDIGNKGLTGAAGLTMTGGRLRMSKLNTTLPELEGKDQPYDISNGTIEWYDSDAGSEQLIRGTDFYGNSIVYHNIELNSNTGNYHADESNVDAQASFGVAGTLSIHAPTVFRLDESDYVFGPGSIELDSGAVLLYGSPNGINKSGVSSGDGNIRVMGNRDLPGGAGYGFIGPGIMITGDALPDTVWRLWVHKSDSNDLVTLQNSVFVTDSMIFDRGIVITEDSNMIDFGDGAIASNASTSSFVVGPVRKHGNDAFKFPVGDNGIFAPLAISAPANPFASFVARYHRQASPGNVPAYMDSGISHVSYVEYWDLEREAGLPGGDDVYVTLHWTDAQKSIITDLDDLTCAHFIEDSMRWEDLGGTASGFSGPGGFGSVTSVLPLTSYSPISFGSKTGINPLPVELLSFSATVDELGNVILKWTTATEVDNDFFVVERSGDGTSFTELFRVNGKVTSAFFNEYVEMDELPLSGTSYYRLRQVDLDGSNDFSPIVSVDVEKDPILIVNMYTNYPGSQLVISIESDCSSIASLEIYDLQGRLLIFEQIDRVANGFWHQLELTELGNGLYLIGVRCDLNTQYFKIITY